MHPNAKERMLMNENMTKEKQKKVFNAIYLRAFLEFVIIFHVFVWRLTIQLVRIARTHTHRHSFKVLLHSILIWRNRCEISSNFTNRMTHNTMYIDLLMSFLSCIHHSYVFMVQFNFTPKKIE